MAILVLLTLCLAPSAIAADAEVRTVTVTVTDEKGEPVEGLAVPDVALLENGVVRDLTAVTHDRRPLTLVLLVDTSQAVDSFYRLNLVDAVTGFLARLPAGSTYALWTTGDRPTKVVDFTDDVQAASRALVRVVPQGGTTLLDALVEASEDLKKKEGERTAVVAVTAAGPEFSSRDRYQVAERAGKNADLFLAVFIEEGSTSFQNRTSYDYVLSSLTGSTGGLYETTLSPMGVDSALRKLSAHLRGQYRLSYATVPELEKRKIEVKVARPGVRVRVGPQPIPRRES